MDCTIEEYSILTKLKELKTDIQTDENQDKQNLLNNLVLTDFNQNIVEHVHIPDLKYALQPYQQTAVNWMCARESIQPKWELHPLYDQIKTKYNTTI